MSDKEKKRVTPAKLKRLGLNNAEKGIHQTICQDKCFFEEDKP